ncbi:hypothetical protein CASFOL_011710 [Castilleja foliolosa]|uniref:Uncharacterized protein n=1 Tax=Castilleja foliolosa TaxID=1961234 RepID=A0ABD3DWA6_9LAMI
MGSPIPYLLSLSSPPVLWNSILVMKNLLPSLNRKLVIPVCFSLIALPRELSKQVSSRILLSVDKINLGVDVAMSSCAIGEQWVVDFTLKGSECDREVRFNGDIAQPLFGAVVNPSSDSIYLSFSGISCIRFAPKAENVSALTIPNNAPNSAQVVLERTIHIELIPIFMRFVLGDPFANFSDCVLHGDFEPIKNVHFNT